MKKWHVLIDQNGGEYEGWVKFFADEVEASDKDNTLIVDGREMEFQEKIYFSEIKGI